MRRIARIVALLIVVTLSISVGAIAASNSETIQVLLNRNLTITLGSN